MSTRIPWIVAAAAVLFAGTIALSQEAADKKDKPESAGGDFAKLIAPGAHHKTLDALVGKWKLTVKTRESAAARWSESEGTSEFRWAMGGRFLIEETKTKLFGEGFEWMGLHGYDNAKKKHVSAWIDNLGTTIDFMDGGCDEAGTTITYRGDLDDMGGGKTSLTWKLKIESKDRFVVEMSEANPAGEPFVNTEIVGTR